MKKVLITGGASGLGLAMAKRWASTGATVCVADRTEALAQATINAINEAGGQGHFVACDVTDDESLAAVKRYTDEHIGALDVLINSAGVPTAGSIEGESLKAWQWVLDINLLGCVRLAKLYVPDMRKNKTGHIVNVASQAGITSMPFMGSYNASKAALVAYSETMKLELSPFNIGVSVLCPAFVKTNLDKSLPEEQSDMQSVVTKLVERGTVSAEEVAEAAFKAVQNNKFMVITHADGGRIYSLKRWLPNFYFWLMAKKSKPFTVKGYENGA
ncbi:SDR family oxidoreductase [Reinekea marina]|uniref:SDR family oxidoreductase n=1 Tax=Reinekea marina TaxID=1310421 RepID=A0ABV7WVI0_9GAMM|nr:SDR family oxidoreductase [Reinekea marina]MDN3650919.1 SDR family oxidoreductase [Reinekea marina]